MLLYRYPPKKSPLDRQNELMAQIITKKKYKTSMIKSISIGIVILILSLKITVIPLMIFVMLIGISSVGIAFYAYHINTRIYDTKLFTKIYDEKIVHLQKSFFGKTYTEFEIYYNDIEKTYQNNLGDLIFELKSNPSGYVKTTSKNKEETLSPAKSVCLTFVNSEPKYYLIKGVGYRLNYKD